MKMLKAVWGLILLAALVVAVQLVDPPADSPAIRFQRLPDSATAPVDLPGDNTFASLAGTTVADTVPASVPNDEFGRTLAKLNRMAAVFPPAEGALRVTLAAHKADVLSPALQMQLGVLADGMQDTPQSASAVEKFRDNFMPLWELAKRCRNWEEFATILRQADSADQVKVLAKITSTAPAAATKLSQVLIMASSANRPLANACIDYILRAGPRGLETLHAALRKGPAGLKLVIENPGLTASTLGQTAPAQKTWLTGLQEQYQAARQTRGASVAAVKYLAIAVLCGLLVLVAIPGRYLEKLIARPGGTVAAPGVIHYLLSALAVGVVLSGLAYLLSLAVKPAPVTTLATMAGEASAPAVGERTDSALLSGIVVLASLAIHAVVWFIARGKIRTVEDDEASPVPLRLKRLENLDIFLDLPLFTGLALTVVAFILITLDAGMRHFAYTSTVVGILSAVSLRIRYMYPLKERLIRT